MPKIHPAATLTPHFRDFLPQWVARQPWYLGEGVPSLKAIGYFRFEDPAGEVGIETHLVTDGAEIYQLPMTYRGAPLTTGDADDPLIAVAEHSLLGTRWIYDATADPVWIAELLALVSSEGCADLSRTGVGATTVRGSRFTREQLAPESTMITLSRVLTAGEAPRPEPGLLGLVLGSWQPDGQAGVTVSGRLAVVRARTALAGTALAGTGLPGTRQQS